MIVLINMSLFNFSNICLKPETEKELSKIYIQIP